MTLRVLVTDWSRFRKVLVSSASSGSVRQHSHLLLDVETPTLTLTTQRANQTR